MSDLELFNELGGAEDAIITRNEFISALAASPKFYKFGQKLSKEQLVSMFARMSGNPHDVNLDYIRYKMFIQDIESQVKEFKCMFVQKVNDY